MSSGLLVDPCAPPVPALGGRLLQAHDVSETASEIQRTMSVHGRACGCSWDQIRRRLQPESDGLLPTVAHLAKIRRFAVVSEGSSGAAVLERDADGSWTLTANSQSCKLSDPLTAAALCSLTVGHPQALEVIHGKESDAVALLLPWHHADEVEVNTETGLINLWSSTRGVYPTFIADYDGDATLIRCFCEPADPDSVDALVHDGETLHLLCVGGHYWVGGTGPGGWEYAGTEQEAAVGRFRHRTDQTSARLRSFSRADGTVIRPS